MVEFTEQKKAQVNDMKNNSARSALLLLSKPNPLRWA